jgi:hypothetical protein
LNGGSSPQDGGSLTNLHVPDPLSLGQANVGTVTVTNMTGNAAGLTNLSFTLAQLTPTSNATNYTVNFGGRDRQYIDSGNTNANITFANINTNRGIDLFVYATTSTAPCIVTFPVNVLHNNYWNLTVTNGQAQTYHLEAHKGTDPTNVVVTGGDYYHR